MEHFAGYGFNRSHSAAYALLAYQTAYLKATYPVFFMAALLTSEKQNTDKVVQYLQACRDMDIGVLPPDINESELDFAVVGDKIRFGLAAVKNVGESAIESMLAARAKVGRFESPADLCEEVDLRLVNKRVLESLVKSGCFDSFGAKRAQLMAIADRALDYGQQVQRERESGQGSLFGDMGGVRPEEQDLAPVADAAHGVPDEGLEWLGERLPGRRRDRQVFGEFGVEKGVEIDRGQGAGPRRNAGRSRNPSIRPAQARALIESPCNRPNRIPYPPFSCHLWVVVYWLGRSLDVACSRPLSIGDRLGSGVEHDPCGRRACADAAPANDCKDYFIERDGALYAGAHLIVDLWDAERLDDIGHIEATLKDCVEAAGATLLHIHLHHFTPNHGVSGVAVLAESHISIHTWPERGYAALDVFMCGDTRASQGD